MSKPSLQPMEYSKHSTDTILDCALFTPECALITPELRTNHPTERGNIVRKFFIYNSYNNRNKNLYSWWLKVHVSVHYHAKFA